MRYEIVIMPEAAEDFRSLRAVDRSAIQAAVETHLRFAPRKESKSRIKRLRELKQPEYRLRVGEYRVFYDVVAQEVHILAVVPKSEAQDWLECKGVKT